VSAPETAVQQSGERTHARPVVILLRLNLSDGLRDSAPDECVRSYVAVVDAELTVSVTG
jgi:hypothetical protein